MVDVNQAGGNVRPVERHVAAHQGLFHFVSTLLGPVVEAVKDGGFAIIQDGNFRRLRLRLSQIGIALQSIHHCLDGGEPIRRRSINAHQSPFACFRAANSRMPQPEDDSSGPCAKRIPEPPGHILGCRIQGKTARVDSRSALQFCNPPRLISGRPPDHIQPVGEPFTVFSGRRSGRKDPGGVDGGAEDIHDALLFEHVLAIRPASGFGDIDMCGVFGVQRLNLTLGPEEDINEVIGIELSPVHRAMIVIPIFGQFIRPDLDIGEVFKGLEPVFVQFLHGPVLCL